MYNNFFFDLPIKKYDFGKKRLICKNARKFAQFGENLMAHCSIPIECRIPNLHQHMHNNILHWNQEGFLDTSIVKKKMTVSLKPLIRPKNSQF